ncbi:MAG TPA: hypothetical protein VK150_04925 [Geothrix sp.]|nr:hypothetical protein [Geothrix sp.]
MLTTVILRGHLGRQFGSRRTLAVRSPSEAVQALCATVPGFERALLESGCGYKILVRGEAINPQEELALPTGQGEIRIVPVVAGAKNEFLQILTGAALLALAFTPMGIGTTALEYGLNGIFGMGAAGIASATSMVGYMGLAMALGGVSRLLTGAQDPTVNQSSQRTNGVFTSAQNTVAQGVPVPCAYGEIYCTPPLISEAIDQEVITSKIFGNFDGAGTWAGNGDTAPWGASIKAV